MLLGFSVYAMDLLYALVFLIAPALFAAQFRKGVLASIARRRQRRAGRHMTGGWLIVQNTLSTISHFAVAIMLVLCAAAMLARFVFSSKTEPTPPLNVQLASQPDNP